MTTADVPSAFEEWLWQAGERLAAGNPGEAAAALERALALRPNDLKAQSLFALVLLKLGKLSEARSLYETLVDEHPEDAGLRLNRGLCELKLGASDAALREIEEAARLDPENPRVVSALELVRRMRRQAQALPASNDPTGPERVTAYVLARLPKSREAAPGFSLEPDGSLTLRVDGALYARLGGVAAFTAGLAIEPARRRVRGRGEGELPGFHQASGQGFFTLRPQQGKLIPLLLDQDILYVRESALLAFEGRLHWEAGRPPGGEPPLVQLRGSGSVALQLAREPLCRKLDPEKPLCIPESALLGWLGRIFPRALVAPGLGRVFECRGEGVLLSL